MTQQGVVVLQFYAVLEGLSCFGTVFATGGTSVCCTRHTCAARICRTSGTPGAEREKCVALLSLVETGGRHIYLIKFTIFNFLF